MPIPANLTPETAIAIGALPYSTTQQVSFGGTVYSVWYAFTAPDSYVYAVFAHGNFDDYFVDTKIYTLVGGVPVGYRSFGSNTFSDRPCYFSVTSGVTYYIKCEEDGDPAAPDALLTLQFQRAPDLGIATGDLLVPDEILGFPAVVLSPTTGAVKGYRLNIPDSVSGDVRSDGLFLVDNRTVKNLELFQADGTRLAVVPFNWTGAYPIIRTSWTSGRLYVINRISEAPGPTDYPIIRTVLGDGSFGPVTWTLPQVGLVGAAPSHDDTVLYHTGQGYDVFADGAPVQRYDLVTAAPTTDLAAGVPNYAPRSLLVLEDDTVLVLYGKRTSVIDAFVRRYSTAGATLNTYALGEENVTGFASNYLFRALGDPASFWVRSHPRVGGTFNTSRHRQIRISDGVVLATVDTPEFLSGVMQGNTDGSEDLFGNSPSCPVFTWHGPPVPPGTSGEPSEPEPPIVAPETETDTRYLRRLRRAPHVNNENRRVFLRTFELDLERGQGLATGQGSDPMVMLRLSRDGGQTWGEEIRMRAGALGAYTQRCLARRLGHARDTVFEVTVSDPIAWSLVGAWLDVEGGTS